MVLGKLSYAVILLGHMYYVVLSMIIGPGRRRTVPDRPGDYRNFGFPDFLEYLEEHLALERRCHAAVNYQMIDDIMRREKYNVPTVHICFKIDRRTLATTLR